MRLTDFVSEFSTCLGVPLANVTTWPGSETAYLLVDWEDMVEPLIGIGRNLAFGRKWLPLVAGSRVPAPIDEGDSMAGCALVSIRLSAGSYGRTLGVWNGTAEADPDGCLSALHDAVKSNGGVINVLSEQGKITMNIYLPVLVSQPAQKHGMTDGYNQDRLSQSLLGEASPWAG